MNNVESRQQPVSITENVEKKRQYLLQQSTEILTIANNQPNSALRCIHLVNVAGGATAATYKAIEQRIREDNDATAAYHLVLMAQSTADLPIDARRLIALVVEHGDARQCLALLKNLPLPPVEVIKQRIIASGDTQVLQAMTAYLQDNPEGYGSHINASVVGGQKDRIVPLSE
ncbi:hypothetical protein [Psychrobacter sp. I-STPA10]|uniref:hypothetical protein n=1 Tax=Psychrobacter sp. I-STPA10 TaxID=2585769 RepID=UPI001E3FB573|nr:hypothetical protein [Psychrobacter sp. I-STPA10]